MLSNEDLMGKIDHVLRDAPRTLFSVDDVVEQFTEAMRDACIVALNHLTIEHRIVTHELGGALYFSKQNPFHP